MEVTIDELRKRYREMPIDKLALIEESYVEDEITPEAQEVIEEVLEERKQELEDYRKQGPIDETLKTYTYRDLDILTRWLKYMLWIFVAVSLVGLWLGWTEIQLLEIIAQPGFYIGEAQAKASDNRQALIGGIGFVVFLVTGILFLRWTYLSNKNARALGADNMKFSPGWSVGWYFVPIAMFWKPYQALKEIFLASHPQFTKDWKHAPRPRLLPAWWTLLIISSFLGHAIFKVAIRADTIFELILASWVTILSDTLDILLGIVVILLVSKLHSLQSKKAEGMSINSAT